MVRSFLVEFSKVMQISQFPKKILIILYKIHSIAHKAYVVGMAGSRWKRHIVVNSMQARLRAQLGDRSKYSGERRRRSVVVASIVLTITDPLRGSYHFGYYLQATLIRSCGASFACMELTTTRRRRRLYLFGETDFSAPISGALRRPSRHRSPHGRRECVGVW